jgi:uncharacterized membrane protein YgcG
MGFLLTVALFVVFMACVGFLYTEGMWGNAVRLVNVVTAALLATNFWEPLADGFEKAFGSSLTYVWDFVAIWALFIVFLLIFRVATKFVSKVQVRFLAIVNRVGSGVFAAWIGWVMVCFTLMTLHTAPLKEKFLFGGFKPGENMFVGLAPDQLWLGFMERMSKGPFSRSPPRVFDPNHKFIPTYAQRRAELEEHVASSSKGIMVSASGAPARMGSGSSGGGSSGGGSSGDTSNGDESSEGP